MPPSPTRGIPHTALTDHRLLKDPASRPATFEEGEIPVESLVLFDGAADRLPKASIDRAWGLLLATRAASASDQGMAERAIDFLSPDRDEPLKGLDRLSGDAPALTKLGLAYVVAGRSELAAAAWKRALKLRPGNELILDSLTRLYATQGDNAAGLRYAQQLVAANPHLAEYHFVHAMLLDRTGDKRAAIAAAEKAIERDPSATSVRQWLAAAYAETDQPEKSRMEQAVLDRWPK
jgi:tetratricopeptide (TPR) repeat protein